MFKSINSVIRKILNLFTRVNSSTIYIGNFPYSTNKSDLLELFSKFGDIKNIRVIKDSNYKRSKGFGFITFKEISAAKKALNLEGTKYKGRTIRVRISKPLTKK